MFFRYAVMLIGLLGYSVYSAAITHNVQPIPGIFHRVANQYSVPASMLYAIALNETGRRVTNIKQPYPWSINVKGRSYFYPSQIKACQALQQFISRYPLKNIDVGIAQVNLGWNGIKYFRSACEGFDVTKNLNAAAQILRDCYVEKGNWLHASGCYHHPKGGFYAARYMRNIKQHLSILSSTSSVTPDNWTSPPAIAGVSVESDQRHYQWILPSQTIQTAFIWVDPNKESQ
ncbi:lytic transglycosylase [Gallibacterium anatis]|uniref:lytic transglycosylase n=1 Tax=Gallibacterium anatis TaxID=750 RepID=UPI001B32746B|nr:lytic transglycosylase [Gallibacterium anatis]MBP4132423.1 lytic transglycosylase [Gallibacterium anatis]